MKNPLVSIIISNYNGKKWLEKCLPTIKKISYTPVEIIIVNNGSTDDSNIFLKKNYPDFKVIELKKNRGFAGANNLGVKKAKGKYVLLLNNDTKVTSNFLKPLVKELESDDRIGVAQPQLRSMRNNSKLDSVASFFTSTGFLYHYGYFQNCSKKQYNKKMYAYAVKGACLFIRRNLYIRVGGLDEDFICYVEESDLCHRVLLSGMKIKYVPESYIYHWGGGDMSVMEKNETTAFRNFRNRFYSYIKNFSSIELIKILPIHFILSELFIIFTLLKGNYKNAAAAQLGILWCIFHLNSILNKRKFIQKKIRKVNDSEFLPSVTVNPPLSYYWHFITNPEGLYNEPELNI